MATVGGVFDLTTADDMLAKLRLEVHAFKYEQIARHAVNALWTGYHLLEWVWEQRLRRDPALQTRVNVNSEGALRELVKREYPLFHAINALANGSKHFARGPRDPATGAHAGSFSNSFSKAFDVSYLYIEVDGARHDMEAVLDGLLEYWERFFGAYLRAP